MDSYIYFHVLKSAKFYCNIEHKNMLLNVLEECIECMNLLIKRFNKDYTKQLEFIKELQATILLDNYEEAKIQIEDELLYISLYASEEDISYE